jgi:hypothetical protein
MGTAMDRTVNDAFRLLRKRVRVFARRHVSNIADVDDMTNDACEKAWRRFSALTAEVELTVADLPHFMEQAYRRAATALHGSRIDHYRRREVERRFLESASHDLIEGSWLGGGRHTPAPDQRLIVEQTMAAVRRLSTAPAQRRLSDALQRRVDCGELDVSPRDLAEEAQETPNSRHAWARKLSNKL